MAKKAKAEKQQKPVTDVIAGVGTDIFRGWIGRVLQNPDYILSHESGGKGLKLYDEMLDKDGHLFSVVQTRKLGVLSKPWEILPGSDDARDIEICEFVRSVIYDITYFDRDLAELLDAIPKGFSVSEVMWEVREGKVVIKELLSRDPRRFVFDTDNALRLKTRSAMFEGVELPPRKFLVHVFDPKYENPYGQAILKRCYWPYWFKKNGIKFWMVFAEKFGSPTTVGKYKPGTTKEKIDELLEILKTIQQETGIAIPENMVVELLEAQGRRSTDTYQAIAAFFNSEMSQVVLGQTLTSGEGRHGTQALGSVHQGVRQDYIEADCNSLQPVLDELISWLVDFNFGPAEKYPYFKIHYEEPGDLLALAERDYILFRKLAVPIARKYFYETYGIPAPDDDDDLLEIIPEGFGGTPGGEFSGSKRRLLNAVRRFIESKDPRRNIETEELLDAIHCFSGDSPDSTALRAGKSGTISFAEDEGQRRYLEETQELFGAAMDPAANIYEELTGAAMKPFAKKKDDAPVRIDMLWMLDNAKLDPEPLANHLRDTLLTADLMAWRHFVLENPDIADEIMGNFGGRGARFAATLEWIPLPPEKAIEFFKGLIPVTEAEIKALGKRLGKYGFYIAGVETKRVLELVKAALTNALEEGITLGEFRRRVNALFDAKGISRLSRHHIENVFLTNLHTAYSAGVWDALHDPDTAELIPYYMYLTAGDESVRPNHAAMHRFVARRDDPIWLTWWPPNGYRCRCRPVAVSKYEVAKKNIQPSESLGVMPDDGFEGTPMEQLAA